MARLILDDNMLEWEAYATVGDFGYPKGSHIVFNCLSDLSLRPRFVARGEKAAVEREIEELDDARLLSLLAEAVELR